MKKLLSIFSSLGLIATSSLSVVACTDDEPTTVDEKVDIAEIVKTTAIGYVANNELATLVDAINSINDIKIFTSNFEFEGTPTDTTATIKAKEDSTKFKGTVTITFNIIQDFTVEGPEKVDSNYYTFNLVTDNEGKYAAAELVLGYSSPKPEIKFETDKNQTTLDVEEIETSGMFTTYKLSKETGNTSGFTYLYITAPGYNEIEIHVKWFKKTQ